MDKIEYERCPYNRQKAEVESLKQSLEEIHADTKEHFETFKIEQQAEIEKLNIELQAMRGAANSYKAEVERYEKTVGTLATKKDGTVIATLNGNKTEYIPKNLHKIFKNMAVNRAKSEAIKEFAEKLKEHFPSIANAIDFTVEEVLKD